MIQLKEGERLFYTTEVNGKITKDILFVAVWDCPRCRTSLEGKSYDGEYSAITSLRAKVGGHQQNHRPIT